ncbi:MAG: nucleotidyltransferase family protein [Myxococcales bacterium]|nr:nucleotidyltransferase family protein [Myxococcales bacterium]
MIAAVVLAAGASTRMGRPKQLLLHRGRSFVRCAVDLAAGCQPIVVVDGAVDLSALDLGPVVRVHNPTWPEGQLSSLRRALAALPAAVTGLLVLTVDRPHIEPATVTALLAAFNNYPDDIWQPAHAGRRGHPIVYPAALLPALRDLPRDASPRDLLERHPRLRRQLAVDDPAVLDNLDSPADLVRLP